MSIPETADFESDPRFPTGPWKGYWLQAGKTGLMKLTLAFAEGVVVGDGSDLIGEFDVRGVYSIEDRTIGMTKTYRGGHEVWYRGRPISGELLGEWLITGTPARGGWRIWPIEDEFEIVHLQIETEDGSVVIYGEVNEDHGKDDS